MRLQLSTLGKARAAWDRFFFDPEDALPYSFFRIFYAALLLTQNLAMYPSLRMFYGEQGTLPFATSRRVIGPLTWTLFTWLPKTDASLYGMYWVMNGLIVLLMFGLFSRFAAIGTYICLVTFHHRNNLITDGEDTMFRLLGFLLMFMPLDRMLSLDRVIGILRGKRSPDPESREAAPTALRMVQVYMCFMYFSACLWKLKGKEWVEGTAMYYVSRLDDFFGRFPVPKFPFEYLPLTKAITWSVLWVEGLVPFLVWFKETRRPALLVAVAFHLGCEYSMNLFMFHYIMILGWMCHVSDEEMRRAGDFLARLFTRLGVKRLTVTYDGNSIPCRRVAAALGELDIFGLLNLQNGRTAKKASIENGAFQVESSGGFAAVRRALRSVPVAWPLLPILYLPGVGAWRAWPVTESRATRATRAA